MKQLRPNRRSKGLKVGAILLLAFALLLSLRIASPHPVAIERHRFFEGVRKPMNIAHRGASGEQSEHSWDAYDLALNQGADALELDIRMTQDAILVVAHDSDLRRVAGTPLKIAESTLAELQAAAGQRAPLALSEVLARYPGRLNVEIKERRPEIAARLAGVLSATGRLSTVMVASFHADVLEAFRTASAGQVATSAHGREAMLFVAAYLLGLPLRPGYVALQIPRRVGAWLDLGRPSFVRHAHRQGLAVHYWTIDDEAEMRELLKAGADGIMTNFPARLEAAIAESPGHGSR